MSMTTSTFPYPGSNSSYPTTTQNSHHHNMQAHNNNFDTSIGYSYPRPSTPPKTPQKADYGRTNGSVGVVESASKPRTKGKNRSRNVTKSPAVTGGERKQSVTVTQPSAAVRPISTPSTAAAFAGPTFHASPAPSALPLPSFLSKSIPDSPGLQTFKARGDESFSGDSDSSTPPSTKLAAAQPNREESPLDFFFKADREEKARARSVSSISNSVSGSGPFQPPAISPRANHHHTPTGSQGRQRSAGGSASGIFAMEVDGSEASGQPYGPSFSTPYSERINAARSAASPRRSPQTYQEPEQSNSDALKAYLFSHQPATTRPVDAADAPTGFSRIPLRAGATFRNTTIPVNGSRSTGPTPRGYVNHNPYLMHSTAAHNSPFGPRSSGLCQEIGITPTKSSTNSPGGPGPYPDRSTPSRVSRHDSPSVSYGFNNLASGNATPNTFATSSGGVSESTDLKGMEDSLRRLLRLEPSPRFGTETDGTSSVPSSTQSVPTYVGGRAPPINSMQPGL